MTDIDNVIVTASPALAPATGESGFVDLDGTAAIQQTTQTVNTVADAGKREDLDADLDALITALHKSTTDWNAVSAFMGAVVPWTASPQDAGWVVMPNGYPDKKSPPPGRLPENGKYPIGPGRAFQDTSVSDRVRQLRWVGDPAALLQRPLLLPLPSKRCSDVTQRQAEGQAHGCRGSRAQGSIWLDVDVGKDGAYATLQDALRAVIDFQIRNKLPKPSAMVASGGGLHVYWISDKALAMTQNEWRPYAVRASRQLGQLKQRPEVRSRRYDRSGAHAAGARGRSITRKQRRVRARF